MDLSFVEHAVVEGRHTYTVEGSTYVLVEGYWERDGERVPDDDPTLSYVRAKHKSMALMTAQLEALAKAKAEKLGITEGEAAAQILADASAANEIQRAIKIQQNKDRRVYREKRRKKNKAAKRSRRRNR